jgi:hypothetical protein
MRMEAVLESASKQEMRALGCRRLKNSVANICATIQDYRRIRLRIEEVTAVEENFSPRVSEWRVTVIAHMEIEQIHHACETREPK